MNKKNFNQWWIIMFFWTALMHFSEFFLENLQRLVECPQHSVICASEQQFIIPDKKLQMLWTLISFTLIMSCQSEWAQFMIFFIIISYETKSPCFIAWVFAYQNLELLDIIHKFYTFLYHSFLKFFHKLNNYSQLNLMMKTVWSINGNQW